MGSIENSGWACAHILQELVVAGEGCSGGPGGVLVCPVCGKTAQGRNRRQNMDNHMLTHTGERPFQCTLCTYRASQQGNLKRHVRTVHKLSLEEVGLNSFSGLSHHADAGLGLSQHRPHLANATPQSHSTQRFDTSVHSLSLSSGGEQQHSGGNEPCQGVREDDAPFGLHLRLKTESEPIAQSQAESGLWEDWWILMELGININFKRLKYSTKPNLMHF